MRLNTLSPGDRRAKSIRVGRGWSARRGKTAGRGTKGQHARNTVKQGFEGGQMPFHRRVPKFGFTSWRENLTAEITTEKLIKVIADEITLETVQAARLVRNKIKFVKIIAGGEITVPLTIKGLKVTKGARQMIEAAGGKIEE
jgi:large subunit ribosomal protein L15